MPCPEWSVGRKGVLWWFLVALVPVLAGCVYSEQVKGNPVSLSALPPLVKGRTLERELLVALGPPQQLSRFLGQTRYTWRFSREELQSLSVHFQGFRLLEGSVEDSTSREAFFDFDARGRLISWSVTAPEKPAE